MRAGAKEKPGQLIDVEAAAVEKISLKNPDGVLTFRKDEKGELTVV